MTWLDLDDTDIIFKINTLVNLKKTLFFTLSYEPVVHLLQNLKLHHLDVERADKVWWLLPYFYCILITGHLEKEILTKR